MEKKFSKGKWIVSDDTSECFMIESEDGGLICTVHDGSFDDDAIHMDVVEANAKLIAAAPDMLEALESFVYEIEKTRSGYNILEESYHLAKEAIKKATE